MKREAVPPRGLLMRALDGIERVGNALPHPTTLFVLFALAVVAASWICARLGVSAIHPKDGTTIAAVNLLDAAGIRRMITEAVRNFMGFAPLGTVLATMIGIGIAEGSGLISAALRGFVTAIPRGLLTAAVVFAGVNANQAADAGIIVLPPIAGMLFAAAGRNPVAGIAAAFAGVAGGFSANLLPSSLDVLLVAFTQEAVNASRLLPGYEAKILGNYYFMFAATPLLTVVGTWVTHRFVEPRLGPWKRSAEGPEPDAGLAPEERRGLMVAGLAAAAYVLVLALITFPPGAPLRAEGATLLDRMKPFFDSLVMVVLGGFLVPGLAYGIASRRIANDHDAARMMSEAMATMGGYIVLAFAAAQFVSWFAWSNLAAILAISGAQTLRAIGLQDAALLVALILLVGFLNLFTTSASAKWAILAPIFVPMFALLGFSPEGTQAVYRVGDSSLNIVTPLMPYMPFIITFVQKYDPKAGMGTVISTMIPYSITFLVMWTLLLLAFYGFGWPIGPGVHMRLPQ